MAHLVTHLVIAVDHKTGQISFDGDGTREWVRLLFEPQTTTFDNDASEWVAVDEKLEQAALDKLIGLGILVDGIDYNNWQER